MASETNEIDWSKIPMEEFVKLAKQNPAMMDAVKPTPPPPSAEVPKVKQVEIDVTQLETKEDESFEEYQKRMSTIMTGMAEQTNAAIASTQEVTKAEAAAKEQVAITKQVDAVKAKAEHWDATLDVTTALWNSGKYEDVESAYQAALKTEGLTDKSFSEGSPKRGQTPNMANPPKKAITVHPDMSPTKSKANEDLEPTQVGTTREIAEGHLKEHMTQLGLPMSDLENIESVPSG